MLDLRHQISAGNAERPCEIQDYDQRRGALTPLKKGDVDPFQAGLKPELLLGKASLDAQVLQYPTKCPPNQLSLPHGGKALTIRPRLSAYYCLQTKGATNMQDNQEDLYRLIGVQPTATQKEIEDRCLELAEKYHPDRNPHDVFAMQKFAEIEKAFEVLGDPVKRSEYDKRLGGLAVKANARDSIVLRHSFVGYLGAMIGGSIMLLAFYSKPTEPGGTAMLVGSLIAAFCLSVAIRARGKTGADPETAEKEAKAFNKSMAGAVSSVLGVVAGIYFFFLWPGLGLTPESASRSLHISVPPGSRLIVEGCERQSDRIAKCTVRARSGVIEGYRIAAQPAKYVNGKYIDLPPAIVSAGRISSHSAAEISLVIPSDADTLYLSVR